MDDDDFMVVKGRIPKTNKDGSPTVGHLGAGGLRRGDGTVERLVQDLELVDDSDDGPPETAVPATYPPQPRPPTLGEQLVRGAVEGVMSGVGDSIRQATGKEPAEAFLDYIEDLVKGWWQERRLRKTNASKAASGLGDQSATESAEPQSAEAALDVAIPIADDERPPLSREEAELLYGEMLRSAAVAEAIRRRLAGATVYDQDGEQVLGDVRRAELDQVVRQALENNPDLIAEILMTALRVHTPVVPGSVEGRPAANSERPQVL